jgi:imidazolonepropionase-like amidohydrolase
VGLAAAPPVAAGAQAPALIIRGGWLFTATTDSVERNRGILVRGGRLLATDGDFRGQDTTGARVVALGEDEYVLPGLVDVHAHYNMTLGDSGARQDEYRYNPLIFLANGVTSTFPAGEYDPEGMMEARKRIDSGAQVGPRIFNSGPYFGTARPDWNQDATADDIRREVDYWAERGVRGFKAKGISPRHLQPLIERAHLHGLTVAAHLESGFRNSTNAADAVRMGIDRVEHILGGEALSPDRAAYPSWIQVDTASREFRDIVRLFIRNRVVFDPTITAPVYFSTVADKPGFDYWVDERQFFTPEVQEWVKRQPPRKAFPLFDSLYTAMLRTTKAFHDAGGIVTMGTDNPSRGEYLAGFSAHREIHTLTIAGIPPAAALRIATINGARALDVGNSLGSIESGKLADLFVIRGNPLADIRNTRNVRLVVKAGVVHDPQALLEQARGRIGVTAPRARASSR